MDDLIDWADLRAVLWLIRDRGVTKLSLTDDSWWPLLEFEYGREMHWYAEGLRAGIQLEQDRIEDLADKLCEEDKLSGFAEEDLCFVAGVEALRQRVTDLE